MARTPARPHTRTLVRTIARTIVRTIVRTCAIPRTRASALARPMARRTGQAGASGFSLLEAAVAVAMVAILAGTMAPLALKALNQRREAATRRSLKLAFEAMFGARDRRVANLRADFGFHPTRSYPSLPFLVSRCWGQVPVFGRNQGASFFWGYNGPYWQGSVQDGAPVDAWGNPIGLIFDPARGTWQTHSLGPDRARGEDDLFYPSVPASLGSYQATVLVVIARVSADIGGTVTLRWGGNTSAHLASSPPVAIDPQASPQSMAFQAPAGTLELVFQPTRGGFQSFTLPMDLLPGQNREVQVHL